MPRSPFFQGSVRSQGITHSPTPPRELLEDPGALATAIGGAIGRMFYNPERDPRAQQARYYGAQADGQIATNRADAARRDALTSLPDLIGGMTGTPTNRMDTRPLPEADGGPAASPIAAAVAGAPDETDLGEIVVTGQRRGPDNRLTEAEHMEADNRDRLNALRQGYSTLVSRGVPADEAATTIAGLAAGWGLDDRVVGMRAAGHGDFLGEDEAVSLEGQNRIRVSNFAQEAAINDADNRTEIEKAVMGEETDRYAADRRVDGQIGAARIGAGASNYRADRTYQASRENNGEDNAQRDRENRRDVYVDAANNVRTNAAREEAARIRGPVRGSGGRGNRRDAAPAPAPAAAAPPPRRLRYDSNGRLIQG